MFSLGDIISIAIKVEENGERTYREAAAKVADERLAALLQHLADDEASHARWFAELARQLEPQAVDEQLADLGSNMLRGIVGQETFSLADADLSSAATVEQVLAVASEHEQDTILFYQMLSSFVSDPATVEQLERIIEQEQHHDQLLQSYLETGQVPARGPSRDR